MPLQIEETLVIHSNILLFGVTGIHYSQKFYVGGFLLDMNKQLFFDMIEKMTHSSLIFVELPSNIDNAQLYAQEKVQCCYNDVCFCE